VSYSKKKKSEYKTDWGRVHRAVIATCEDTRHNPLQNLQIFFAHTMTRSRVSRARSRRYNSSFHEPAAAAWAPCCRHALLAARLSSQSSSRTTESASSLRCHAQCAVVAFTTLSRPCPKLASLVTDNAASLWFFSKLQTNQDGKMNKKSQLTYGKIAAYQLALLTRMQGLLCCRRRLW
jgi:hypothetical protein